MVPNAEATIITEILSKTPTRVQFLMKMKEMLSHIYEMGKKKVGDWMSMRAHLLPPTCSSTRSMCFQELIMPKPSYFFLNVRQLLHVWKVDSNLDHRELCMIVLIFLITHLVPMKMVIKYQRGDKIIWFIIKMQHGGERQTFNSKSIIFLTQLKRGIDKQDPRTTLKGMPNVLDMFPLGSDYQ